MTDGQIRDAMAIKGRFLWYGPLFETVVGVDDVDSQGVSPSEKCIVGRV